MRQKCEWIRLGMAAIALGAGLLLLPSTTMAEGDPSALLPSERSNLENHADDGGDADQ